MIRKLTLAMALLFTGLAAHADDRSDVEAMAEQFRVLMVAPDKTELEKLMSPDLSFGHSSGLVQTRDEYIDRLMTGLTNFLNIKISDQTVKMVDDTAIIYHTLDADAHNKGQDAKTVHIKVLQVWKKAGQGWQLLVRQAIPLAHS